MKAISILVVAVLMITSTGCFENMSRDEKSVAGGAVIGATVGGHIGRKKANAGKGILIDAAAGAVGGYIFGKISQPKEGEVATVDCPYCKSTNELPAGAKAGSIIQCGSCGKQFQLQ